MFTLVRSLSLRRLALEQIPTVAVAWLLAEAFYKFHSFTLEAGAFLGTWFVLDAGVQFARSFLSKPQKVAAQPLR
ncbi:MAG: hypothetical protein O7H41_14320 [Planctomycetota bacterium]|nr:hypothetical protein [Planctomycetota bacterium]